jgi:hypothetical protein
MNETKSLFILISQIFKEVIRLAKSIYQQAKCMNEHNQENHKNEHVQPPWLEPILSAYKESVGKNQINDDRQHKVQRSICKATWAAFFAVAVYAGLTYLMWREAHNNFLIDQRAWVGMISNSTVGAKLETPPNTIPYVIVQNVVLAIHNSGKTPARELITECCILRSLSWTQAAPDFDTEAVVERERYKRTLEGMRGPLSHIQGALKHPERYTAEQIERMKEEERDTLTVLNSSWQGQFSSRQTIAPNASIMLQVFQSAQRFNVEDEKGSPLVEYILGKLIYQDVFKPTVERSTKFCLMMREPSTLEVPTFNLCSSGNWMD